MSEPQLTSPAQLPALEGDALVLAWDQIDAVTLVLFGNTVVWRETTGWEVYERFGEIAEILREAYGRRLKDLVPTARSRYALFGDSSRATFVVDAARRAIREASA